MSVTHWIERRSGDRVAGQERCGLSDQLIAQPLGARLTTRFTPSLLDQAYSLIGFLRMISTSAVITEPVAMAPM